MNQKSEMSEKTKKQKKGLISEEDVSTILQRYSATTVLALLEEVAQVQDAKIDWNALVRRTKTGITNPREYQMLWRHLAYRDALLEKFEDDAKPLDDDSDLECELEVFPPVSNEASTEAAACVKVLIASGSTSKFALEKGLTVEAPLTINIPSGPSEKQISNSTRGTNITVPVSVQKQPLPTAAYTEGTDTNGSASGALPPRRKRKPWTEAEDMELFAAVQKCGEGNWANILRGDFKGDRTASQLSQRWNIIKKRGGNSNVRTGMQLSEAQLAARRALNMALDQPKSSSSLGRTKSGITTNTSIATKPRPDEVKVAAGTHIPTQSAAAVTMNQRLKTATQPHLNVGPVAQLSQNGTAPETNSVVVSSSAKSTKEVQENGNLDRVEASGLNETLEEKCKQHAASEPVIMEICENRSAKTNKKTSS